jgi:hypothetical protein
VDLFSKSAALHGCPHCDLAGLGGEIGFCQGVVFKFAGDQLAGVEVKRLPRL